MNLDNLKELKNSNNAPFRINSKSIHKGQLNINHLFAIPIEEISSFYKTDSDISIYDPQGNEIGFLCFTKELGTINWRNLTENQFIAFLVEADFSSREDDYVFLKNYLVLKDIYYEDYINKYKENSSIWGGFFHSSTLTSSNYKKNISRIEMQELKLANTIFKENAIRSVLQPFGHERFLKLYHLIELRFDLDVIKEIQNLNVDLNPEKIGRIFSDYSQREIPRLKSIIENNCQDINSLVSCLNGINNYQDIAKDIFYKFGKEGNPLKEEIDFVNVCPFGFSQQSLRNQNINFQNNHPKFIQQLVTYWIYRIRCSVAHNRIGEYILSNNQEEFLVEFAEPLLREVLKQCFKP